MFLGVCLVTRERRAVVKRPKIKMWLKENLLNEKFKLVAPNGTAEETQLVYLSLSQLTVESVCCPFQRNHSLGNPNLHISPCVLFYI